MSEEREKKPGTAWIQNLSKKEVIEELAQRGVTDSEGKTLEELRPLLRTAIRKGREAGENKEVISGRIMEYTSQLDFKIGVDDWDEFVERIDLYFEANGIAEEKKRAIFLTKVDAETYKVVRKVCAPAKPKEVALEDIIQKVGKYIKPKANKTVLRAQFRERKQKGNETITQYVAALRSLATECEFANEEEAIMDQLLSGIKDRAIKIALFKNDELTLDQAWKTAIAIEEANRAAETLETNTPDADKDSDIGQEVYKVQTKFKYNRNGRSGRGQQQGQWQTPDDRVGKEGRGTVCSCCGKGYHWREECWHRTKRCDVCGRQGHLQAVCKELPKRRIRRVQNIEPEGEGSDSETEQRSEGYGNIPVRIKNAQNCNRINIEPQILGVEVEGKRIEMEVDGGSEISLINKKDCRLLFPNKEIEEAKIRLVYYSGERQNAVGVIRKITFKFGAVTATGDLYVVGERGKPLIGRGWLHQLRLWPLGIKQATGNRKIRERDEGGTWKGKSERDEKLGESFIKRYEHLFTPGLGTYNKAEFKIRMAENTVPIYYKPRNLPFALKEKVEAEIERLVKEGVWTPVEVGEWGTPVVPILKEDGSLRLCGDYKLTVNKTIITDRHPIPKIEHLLANLHDAVYFSKIDLKEAYAQVPLDEEAKKYLTLSTHKGLYQPNKLPYGVASAPGFFQRQMEQILAGMGNVNVFLDDIIIKGKTKEENLKNTAEVLKKLGECGLKLKKSKCILLATKIKYLGLEIDRNGIHALTERVEAIDKTPRPKNVKELQAFLGMLNYYARFIKDRATKLRPLYELLKKEKYEWSDDCQEAFEKRNKA